MHIPWLLLAHNEDSIEIKSSKMGTSVLSAASNNTGLILSAFCCQAGYLPLRVWLRFAVFLSIRVPLRALDHMVVVPRSSRFFTLHFRQTTHDGIDQHPLKRNIISFIAEFIHLNKQETHVEEAKNTIRSYINLVVEGHWWMLKELVYRTSALHYWPTDSRKHTKNHSNNYFVFFHRLLQLIDEHLAIYVSDHLFVNQQGSIEHSTQNLFRFALGFPWAHQVGSYPTTDCQSSAHKKQVLASLRVAEAIISNPQGSEKWIWSSLFHPYPVLTPGIRFTFEGKWSGIRVSSKKQRLPTGRVVWMKPCVIFPPTAERWCNAGRFLPMIADTLDRFNLNLLAQVYTHYIFLSSLFGSFKYLPHSILVFIIFFLSLWYDAVRIFLKSNRACNARLAYSIPNSYAVTYGDFAVLSVLGRHRDAVNILYWHKRLTEIYDYAILLPIGQWRPVIPSTTSGGCHGRRKIAPPSFHFPRTLWYLGSGRAKAKKMRVRLNELIEICWTSKGEIRWTIIMASAGNSWNDWRKTDRRYIRSQYSVTNRALNFVQSPSFYPLIQRVLQLPFFFFVFQEISGEINETL